MEMLPSATYLQKWSWMEGVPSTTYLWKSCWWKHFQEWCIYKNGHGWKGFQAQHIYRKVTDGNASKCDIFTKKGQGAKMGLGVPWHLPPFKRVTSWHCWGWRGVEWDGIKVAGSNVVSCSRVSLIKVCYMFWSMDVIPGLPWIVFHPKSFPFD